MVPTLAKNARMGQPQVVVIHGAKAQEWATPTNNCPKFEPAPAPSPTTTIAVGGVLTVLLYIILIAGAPVGF